MKNILALVGILLVLSGLAYWIWQSQPSKKTLDGDESAIFAIADPEDLGRIFMADRQGNQLILERGEEGWLVTDKVKNQTFPARPDAVTSLMEALTKVRTRSSVPKAALANVVKEVAAKGKKVELYDRKNRLIKTYYVGRPADGGYGTYMMMEGAEQPFITFTPGWVGTLDTRFMTEPKEWRDRAVFRLNPERLEWVEMDYQAPDQKNMSFRVQKSGKSYAVSPLYPELTQPLDAKRFNAGNAQAYINQFELLGAEVLLHEQREIRDSVFSRIPPFAKLRLKHKNGEQAKEVVIYPQANPAADRGDGETGTRQQMNRYYAYSAPDEFFLLQHLVLRNFLWGYPFFFKPEPVVFSEGEDGLWSGQQ